MTLTTSTVVTSKRMCTDSSWAVCTFLTAIPCQGQNSATSFGGSNGYEHTRRPCRRYWQAITTSSRPSWTSTPQNDGLTMPYSPGSARRVSKAVSTRLDRRDSLSAPWRAHLHVLEIPTQRFCTRCRPPNRPPSPQPNRGKPISCGGRCSRNASR